MPSVIRSQALCATFTLAIVFNGSENCIWHHNNVKEDKRDIDFNRFSPSPAIFSNWSDIGTSCTSVTARALHRLNWILHRLKLLLFKTEHQKLIWLFHIEMYDMKIELDVICVQIFGCKANKMQIKFVGGPYNTGTPVQCCNSKRKLPQSTFSIAAKKTWNYLLFSNTLIHLFAHIITNVIDANLFWQT